MRRGIFLLLFSLTVASIQAQDLIATGVVTTAAEPGGLPGVNVVVKGTSDGTITDLEGRFSLKAPKGSTLVFSFIGYQPKEVVFANQTNLEVTLTEEPKQLEEVVVVGYSSVERRDLTGAVASVKSSSYKDFAINGIDQALQGQAAGVQVTQSSGTPGGGVKVKIRGVSSINAGTDPLYIVDGIPVETGGLSARGFGGQGDNALSLINPNDIESTTVLLDAAYKNMYGSRASNGVVVITTKRGKTGAPKITFDVQRGIINAVRLPDLMNSSELLDLQREAVTNAGLNPDAFGLIKDVTDGVNTNWVDEVLRTGILQQYQLSASGGDEKNKYYINGSYRDEQGIQLNNKFSRLAGTFNFDHKLTERFTLSNNFMISRGFNKRVKGDNFLDGVYSGALRSLPYYVPYDQSGAIVGPSSPLYASFPNFNPVGQALLPRFDTQSVKLLTGMTADYKINDLFSLQGKISLDYNNVTDDQYESSQTAIGGFLESVGLKGYGFFATSTFSTVMSNVKLNFNKKINDHSINANFGSELLQQFNKSGNVQGRVFPSDDFTYIASAGIVDSGSSFRSQNGLVSVFAQGQYDYADRFLFSALVRMDGSSHFGPNNKLGFFPALSGAWRISNESFFHSSIVSDLKVRGSFGITGNERLPNFAYLGQWGPTTYNGSSGTTANSIDNPDLKWEQTRELGLGMDISLLDGRIQSSVNVYHNTTFDLLLFRPYATTTGFSGVDDNIGKLENKGLEFTLTGTILQSSGLKWTASANWSKNLNKVLQLADTIPLYRGYSAEGVDATNIIKEGEPLGTFWGLGYLGVDPGTGSALYEDSNQDGAITTADAKVIGNSQAKFTGGITNSLSYQNFSLSFFFNYSVGNKILNLTRAGLVNMGADLFYNQLREADRRWKKEGDITDVPKYIYGNSTNNYHSNRLLEDGSYLRLKNVTLGYNIPSDLATRFKFSQLRVYATATNLWTLTKYTGSDPEVSTLDGSNSAAGIDYYTLPQVKTITIGLNATLK